MQRGRSRPRSDDAYRRLLAAFVDFYAENLFNPHWGEQVGVGPANLLDIHMVFQGLDGPTARWPGKPSSNWSRPMPGDYKSVRAAEDPAGAARVFWDGRRCSTQFAPASCGCDDRSRVRPRRLLVDRQQDEVGDLLARLSIRLAARLVAEAPSNRRGSVDAWFAATNTGAGVSLHINKGLAGAPAARSKRRETRR